MEVDRLLQRDVGARIAELRRALGLTQDEFALRVGSNAKHLQRIEAGQANLTLRSLATIALALGVDVSALFRTPTIAEKKRGRPRREQTAPAFPHARVTTGSVLTRAVPLLTLMAQAGVPDSIQDTGIVDWLELPGRPRAPGLFIVRIIGDSMAPRFRDGALCLFRAGTTHAGDGALVLIEVEGEAGSGRYLFKRLRALNDGDGLPEAYALESLNPKGPVLEYKVREGGEVRVVAELVEVLAQPNS